MSQTLIKNDDGSTTYLCPDCGFESAGWPTQTAAKKRGAEHQEEHETGVPAPELKDSEAR